MTVSYQLAKALFELGFSLKAFQDNPDRSMTFYKDEVCFLIGGDLNKELSTEEKMLIKESVWLPNMFELLKWLEINDFSYSISYTKEGRCVECIDQVTGTRYVSTSPIPPEYALAANIKKILKHKERDFDTKAAEETGLFQIIDQEETRE